MGDTYNGGGLKVNKILLAGRLAACLLAFAVPANASSLDFSSIGCTTGFANFLSSPLSFGTFTLSATNVQFGFQTYCADALGYYPGGPALALGSNSSSVVLTQANFDPFSLNSIGFAQVYTDTGWFASGIPGPITGPGSVTFYATTANNTQVSQTFQFGRNNGPPALEQLVFDSGFSNIVSATWSGGQQNNDYFQFADLDVTNQASSSEVPEPATLTLLGFGGLTCALARRRRQTERRATTKNDRLTRRRHPTGAGGVMSAGG